MCPLGWWVFCLRKNRESSTVYLLRSLRYWHQKCRNLFQNACGTTRWRHYWCAHIRKCMRSNEGSSNKHWFADGYVHDALDEQGLGATCWMQRTKDKHVDYRNKDSIKHKMRSVKCILCDYRICMKRVNPVPLTSSHLCSSFDDREPESRHLVPPGATKRFPQPVWSFGTHRVRSKSRPPLGFWRPLPPKTRAARASCQLQ